MKNFHIEKERYTQTWETLHYEVEANSMEEAIEKSKKMNPAFCKQTQKLTNSVVNDEDCYEHLQF